MGGIGKTQIALKYAYRHGTSYQYVFWLDAKDMTALETSGRIIVEKLVLQRIKKCPSAPDFIKISSELGMPGCLDSSGNINYDALKSPWNVAKRWLAEVGNEQWLLLIDNNDDLDSVDLLEILPSCNWGHVIVTSRREELAFHGHSIPVEEIDDGLGLLLKGMKLKHEDLSKDDLNHASKIVQQLGSFPLALVHAASHMFVKKVDFETYLGKLDKNFMDTFGEIPKVGMYRKGGVFTWELSYRELGPSAARLLHLCAFLSNEDIPDELLRGGKTVAGEWLSADELDNAIEELLTFSFVKRKMLLGKSISIHPIIHRWAREHLEANLRGEKASEAIWLVASVLEMGNAERTPLYWGFERRIRNHLNLCSQHISDYFVDVEKCPLDKDSYVAMRMLGRAHAYWNNYELSIIAYETALIGLQNAVGGDHKQTLDVVHSMASVLIQKAEYDNALEWYQRALDGYEKTLGHDHESTLNTVHCMAIVFNNQGEYDKSLEWYQRALDGYEKTLGHDHISTLDAVYNMAALFNSKGEYDKALEWYQRALDGYEKALGHDHISTLDTVNNMSEGFRKNGEYEKALEWYQRALDGYEKTLGRDHISTLRTVNNMASVFCSEGEYEKALEWYQRALDGQEKALGRDHTSTLGTVNNMANVFYRKGEYEKALEWYQRALDGMEKALGSNHESTLKSVCGMGLTFEKQKEYDKALGCFERALDGYRKIHKNDHKDISDVAEGVSRVKKKMGKADKPRTVVSIRRFFIR
ncbi:TPR-like protein [Wilcoxina mikolae CBS 423.85]|nr:TPR-like protein [Wilcoxina mikolae CBS 423.85]